MLSIAQTQPAGGAAIGEIIIATLGAGVVTAALLFFGLGHRSGKVALLGNIARWSQRISGLPGWAVMLLTTAPVTLLGVFAPLAPRLARRFGAERVLLGAMAVLTAGLLLRPLDAPGIGHLPALLAGTAAFLPASLWQTIMQEAVASALYLENLLLVLLQVDYHARDAGASSPLQHFWSLSVQGQAFVVWPLLFLLVARRARAGRSVRRPLLVLVACPDNGTGPTTSDASSTGQPATTGTTDATTQTTLPTSTEANPTSSGSDTAVDSGAPSRRATTRPSARCTRTRSPGSSRATVSRLSATSQVRAQLAGIIGAIASVSTATVKRSNSRSSRIVTRPCPVGVPVSFDSAITRISSPARNGSRALAR